MVRSKRVMVPRTCLKCKKPFEADLKTVQTGGAKYCSRACYGGDKKRVMEDRTCRGCGKVFSIAATLRKTYCDNACYMANNRVTMVPRTCSNCGKEFQLEIGLLNSGRGTFCSRTCAIHRTRAKHHRDADQAEARKELRKVKRKLRARGLL